MGLLSAERFTIDHRVEMMYLVWLNVPGLITTTATQRSPSGNDVSDLAQRAGIDHHYGNTTTMIAKMPAFDTTNLPKMLSAAVKAITGDHSY